MTEDLMGDSIIVVNKEYLKNLLELSSEDKFHIILPEGVVENVIYFVTSEGIKLTHHNSEEFGSFPVTGKWIIEDLWKMLKFLSLPGEEVSIDLCDNKITIQIEPNEDDLSFYSFEIPCASEWKER